MQPDEILRKVLAKYKSIREFARAIDEDAADVFLWKSGRRKINPRAVISIVKHHPELKAHDLNPNVFEKGLTFNFGE